MLLLFIALVSLILQFFLPWWIISPIAFALAAWKANSGKHAFGSAFGAIFLIWLAVAIVKSLANKNILVNRVAEMLTLPQLSINWILIALITALIGALVAGFSALSGLYIRRIFMERKRA